MDTSHWTKLKADIKFIDTTKKFFGKYLYKIDVYAPAGRVVNEKSSKPLQDRLLQRIEMAKDTLNRLSPYGTRHNFGFAGLRETVTASSLDQLEYYKKVMELNKGAIKIRVEEPTLSVYSDDENLLLDIAANDPCDRVTAVYRPANSQAIAVLEQGRIIIKTPSPYSYKIMLREGVIKNHDAYEQAHNYLVSLGDDVQMTKGCARNLTKRYVYMSSTYFYAKNLECLTFLNLIAPGIVSGIYEIAYVDS